MPDNDHAPRDSDSKPIRPAPRLVAIEAKQASAAGPIPGSIAAELDTWSRRYVDESTALSRRLIEFHRWIDSLPGKLAVTVADGRFTVSLARDGSDWKVVIDPDTESPDSSVVTLLGASIPLKARAAKLLPQLATQLLEQNRTLATQAAAAREELDRMFETLGLLGKKA